MPRSKPGQRPGIVPALGSLNHRTTYLEPPRNPAWLYVTPISPADEPDDYISGFSLYPAFVSPWTNISSSTPPTGFRLVEGKPQIRLAITGGEALTNSLIFTLPVDFRPSKINRLLVSMGVAGEGIGTVEVQPNGDVIFLGMVTIVSGGSP